MVGFAHSIGVPSEQVRGYLVEPLTRYLIEKKWSIFEKRKALHSKRRRFQLSDSCIAHKGSEDRWVVEVSFGIPQCRKLQWYQA